MPNPSLTNLYGALLAHGHPSQNLVLYRVAKLQPNCTVNLPLGSVLFCSCQAVSTSPLAARLWVVMPQVSSSSWLPSSCLVKCIVLQLVQLHEILHLGPECVCVCVCFSVIWRYPYFRGFQYTSGGRGNVYLGW